MLSKIIKVNLFLFQFFNHFSAVKTLVCYLSKSVILYLLTLKAEPRIAADRMFFVIICLGKIRLYISCNHLLADNLHDLVCSGCNKI